MSKLYKVDFHTHPLSHKYYYPGVTPEALDDVDRRSIVSVITMAEDRGLDAVAITDHDLYISGQQAKLIAHQMGAKVKIIPGMECQVQSPAHNPRNMEEFEYVHILAYNMREAPQYCGATHPRDLIDQIHELGGVAILSHPQYYLGHPWPYRYEALADKLDGVEVRNGVAAYMGMSDFDPGNVQDGFILSVGSDYHSPCEIARVQWDAYAVIDEALFARLTE